MNFDAHKVVTKLETGIPGFDAVFDGGIVTWFHRRANCRATGRVRCKFCCIPSTGTLDNG